MDYQFKGQSGLIDASDVGPEAGALSPSRLLRILAANLSLLLWLPLTFFAIALAVMMIRSARFTAESRIHPEAPAGEMNRLAGLAAQFGVALPGGGSGGDPVKLYSEMLTSQTILREALTTPIAIPPHSVRGDTVRTTLLQILDVSGSSPRERLQRGIQKFSDLIDVTPNEGAGTIRLRVTSSSPELAESLNRLVLTLLNHSSLALRQSQASEERKFVEGRLAAAQQELAAAERDIQRFLELNRSYNNSPQLRGEFDRLQRRIELRQQVASALAQAYEQSRIDEQRNTATIVIVDPPEFTARKVGRKRDALIWLVIGFAVATVIAVGRDAAHQYRERNPGYFDELRTSMRQNWSRFAFWRRTPSES